MATNTFSVDDALGLFMNQAFAANTPPQGEGSELGTWNPAMAWTKDIPGFNLASGNWGTSGSTRDPANLAALRNYGPEKIFEKMGWQFDPASQQVTTPWSEDNFFKDFTEFAEIPAIFAALVAGGGGINNLLAGASGAGAGAGSMTLGDASLGSLVDTGAASTLGTGGAGTTLSNFAFSPGATSGGAMDMFGSMNPSGVGSVFSGAPAAGASGFFSNLLTNPIGTLTQGIKSLAPGEVGGVPTTGPFSTGGGTVAGMPWDTITSAGSILTGLMGMNERKKLQQAGTQAAQMQDPFGSQRPQYQQMLAQLMADPSSIASVPGFDAGRLAVERSMAAQGYSPARSKVSGNFLDAMSNYGGNFYNQELARLMTLAGAGIGPSGGNLALTGQIAGTQVGGNSIQAIIAGLKGLLT